MSSETKLVLYGFSIKAEHAKILLVNLSQSLFNLRLDTSSLNIGFQLNITHIYCAPSWDSRSDDK